MYDWPEISLATDTYWQALRESIKSRGFDVPETLTRQQDPLPLWRHPDLLLGQSCGLPYAQLLSPQVSLVGTPAYDVGCGAGSYYSVILVHQDSSIKTLADLATARFGYNDLLSQSGFAAFFHLLKSEGFPPGFIKKRIKTGEHRQSVRALANDEIDVTAIDAITWELAKRHEPAATRLRVIRKTASTAGLPYITAKRPRRDVDRIHMAVIDAMASLDEAIREELLLMGFSATQEDDYQVIKARYAGIAASIEAVS